MTQARAAILHERGTPLRVEPVTLGDPAADEVLVEIAGCGMCHTDLLVAEPWFPGPLPAVFGHEGSGIVRAVGSAITHVTPGDAVALSFGFCGHCTHCAGQAPYLCDHFFPLNFGGVRSDGSTSMHQDDHPVHGHFFQQSAFASHAIAHANSVVKINADPLPLSDIGPLGCGIQTGAGAVMNSLDLQPGQSVAVFGCGTVGLAAIMAAKIRGCDPIIAVDVKPARLAMAAELGAHHGINGLEQNVLEVVGPETASGGMDGSLECTGIPAVLDQALRVLSRAGTCGQIGVPSPGAKLTLDMSLFTSGKRYISIIEGSAIPAQFVPTLLSLWQQGQLPVDKLIRHYPLDAINEAAADMESGVCIKPVLIPG